MSRNLYCKTCGEKYGPMEEEDRADGWRDRRVWQAVQKPADHVIMVDGQRTDLPSLVCDLCNAVIPDGEQALLVTTYHATAPVAAWEHEYAVRDK